MKIIYNNSSSPVYLCGIIINSKDNYVIDDTFINTEMKRSIASLVNANMIEVRDYNQTQPVIEEQPIEVVEEEIIEPQPVEEIIINEPVVEEQPVKKTTRKTTTKKKTTK